MFALGINRTVASRASALEMTCRAPKAGICGGGSTLSEYELYFNFAMRQYPESIELRMLLWANGPAPGLLFWPEKVEALVSDGYKSSWLNHRQNEGKKGPLTLDKATTPYYLQPSTHRTGLLACSHRIVLLLAFVCSLGVGASHTPPLHYDINK